VKAHAVVLAFAITVHKMQGQLCIRLILDINQHPVKPCNIYHGVYVALSYV
jgi:ATP-dependent exoDNAse (exonuclease V) alpha subunit